MEQIFDKGNIHKFLVIHQKFAYQIFLLAIVNVVLTTLLYIFYLPNISQC